MKKITAFNNLLTLDELSSDHSPVSVILEHTSQIQLLKWTNWNFFKKLTETETKEIISVAKLEQEVNDPSH